MAWANFQATPADGVKRIIGILWSVTEPYHVATSNLQAALALWIDLCKVILKESIMNEIASSYLEWYSKPFVRSVPSEVIIHVQASINHLLLGQLE